MQEHNYDNCHNYTCRKKCEKNGYINAIDDAIKKFLEHGCVCVEWNNGLSKEKLVDDVLRQAMGQVVYILEKMKQKEIEIVNQVAEEYSNSEIPNKSDDGWIPCSSGELPQNEGMYLTTVYDKATGRCLLKHRKFENGKFVEGGQSRAFPVIAWQQKQLPAPYKPKGE